MTARIRLLLAAALVAGGLAAVLPVGGTAKPPRPKLTLRAVHSSSLNGYVVANPAGRTLYHRTLETTHHFLCTGSCASIWPPLTVSSHNPPQLVAGAGVHGALSTARRPDGRLQVTLSGHPLYRFSNDLRSGDAKGEGILGEGRGGGVWHASRASAPRHTTTPPPTMTQPPTYTYPPSGSSPGYSYP
ncbi:MAG: hypothetical protein M3155_10170 [Actinomycetota bacterium]|nr:hypothetical protein [Actinomycetota bacterium]